MDHPHNPHINDANRQARQLITRQFDTLPTLSNIGKGMIRPLALSGKGNFGKKKLNKWDIQQAMDAMIKYLSDKPHLMIGKPIDLSNSKRVSNSVHMRNQALVWTHDSLELYEPDGKVTPYKSACISSVMLDSRTSSGMYAVLDIGISVTEHAAIRLLSRIPRELLNIDQFLHMNGNALDPLLLVYPSIMAAILLDAPQVRLPTNSGMFLGSVHRRAKAPDEDDGMIIRLSRRGVYMPETFPNVLSTLIESLREEGGVLAQQFSHKDSLSVLVKTYVDNDMLSSRQEALRKEQLEFIEQHHDKLVEMFMGFSWPQFDPSAGDTCNTLIFNINSMDFGNMYNDYCALMEKYADEFDL